MTKTLVLVAMVVVIGAVAYVAGYWTERQRAIVLEQELETLRPRVSEAEAGLRSARLLGELLNLTDAAASMNYAQAQTLSTMFFDGVSAEAARSPLADVRSALDQVLRSRDAITSALARGEPAVVQLLRSEETRLRGALGYPVSAPERPPAGEAPAPDATGSPEPASPVAPGDVPGPGEP